MLFAENINLTRQGQYLSSYEISYIDKNTGERKSYEIVSKQGSKFNHSNPLTLETLGKNTPAVMAIIFNTTHDKILLCKEFRLGVNDFVYNMTAGLIDPGETPEEAIRREVYEETGLTITNILRKLPNAFTCAPVTDDFIPTFICEAAGEIKKSDNILEDIEPNWFTKSQVLNMIDNEKYKFSAQLQAFAYMWAINSSTIFI